MAVSASRLYPSLARNRAGGYDIHRLIETLYRIIGTDDVTEYKIGVTQSLVKRSKQHLKDRWEHSIALATGLSAQEALAIAEAIFSYCTSIKTDDYYIKYFKPARNRHYYRSLGGIKNRDNVYSVYVVFNVNWMWDGPNEQTT